MHVRWFISMTTDEKFMSIALKEAKKAALLDEVPVGAVLVIDGKVVSKGYNKREKSCDPTDHAEIIAIRKACKKFESWRLKEATLYVTIEPCAMCGGAIIWSRISRVVYGADDPKGGVAHSALNLFENEKVNHHPEVVGGVLKEECASLIKEFFSKKRSK